MIRQDRFTEGPSVILSADHACAGNQRLPRRIWGGASRRSRQGRQNRSALTPDPSPLPTGRQARAGEGCPPQVDGVRAPPLGMTEEVSR